MVLPSLCYFREKCSGKCTETGSRRPYLDCDRNIECVCVMLIVFRLDGKPDNASWFSTSNTTLTFVGLEDGVHTLTVRATEGEESGGSSDQVG